MSLVPGRMNFLSLQKKCIPQTTTEELLLLLYPMPPPPPSMGNDPTMFIVCDIAQVEAMLCECVFFIQCFLLPFLYYHSRTLWFLPFFCF